MATSCGFLGLSIRFSSSIRAKRIIYFLSSILMNAPEGFVHLNTNVFWIFQAFQEFLDGKNALFKLGNRPGRRFRSQELRSREFPHVIRSRAPFEMSQKILYRFTINVAGDTHIFMGLLARPYGASVLRMLPSPNTGAQSNFKLSLTA